MFYDLLYTLTRQDNDGQEKTWPIVIRNVPLADTDRMRMLQGEGDGPMKRPTWSLYGAFLESLYSARQSANPQVVEVHDADTATFQELVSRRMPQADRVIAAFLAGILSEGQVCQALKMDRQQVRRRKDQLVELGRQDAAKLLGRSG
jgi:hypothetical protein